MNVFSIMVILFASNSFRIAHVSDIFVPEARIYV